MPKRIQRKRKKGWRMPAGAVYVGRPPIHGNPFQIGKLTNTRHIGCKPATKQQCVDAFRVYLEHNLLGNERARREVQRLRGKDLVCWCKAGEPCHADVLLEFANK